MTSTTSVPSPSTRTGREPPAAAGHALRHDGVPGGRRADPAELRPRARARAPPRARRSPTRLTGRRAGTRGSSKRRAGLMRPPSPGAHRRPRRRRARRRRATPSRRPAGPGPGRRASSSSRTPAAASAIRRTRCDRRAGSSSEKTSSRSRSGGRPSSAARRSSSASLRARIAVRCWPREANDARSRPSSSKARSSRCGPTSVVPFQSSFSAVSPSRRARASPAVSPGCGRRVRDVAQARASPSPGAISAWAAASGPASSPRSSTPALEDRRARLEELRVPERQLVARRLLLADRPQEVVALGQGPAVGREVRGVGREALRRPGRRGPLRRSAGAPDDEEHLLGGEDDDAQHPGERGRPPRHAVDPDPLAAAGRALPDERDVEVRGAAVAVAPALDAGERRPQRIISASLGGPVRGAAGQEDDRLEEARLAGRVRAPDELRARPERRLERVVGAEAGQAERGEQGAGRAAGPASRRPPRRSSGPASRRACSPARRPAGRRPARAAR